MCLYNIYRMLKYSIKQITFSSLSLIASKD